MIFEPNSTPIVWFESSLTTKKERKQNLFEEYLEWIVSTKNNLDIIKNSSVFKLQTSWTIKFSAAHKLTVTKQKWMFLQFLTV